MVKRFEHKSQSKESSGERGMVVPRDMEETLKFTPFLKGSDATVKKVGRNQISPYKVALVVQDVLVIGLAFGLGAFITGGNFFVWEDPGQFGLLRAGSRGPIHSRPKMPRWRST